MALKDLLLEDKKILEQLAVKINEHFFGGELPEIIINTEPTKKALGHFWAKRWKHGENEYSEINISPIFFDRGPLSVVNTLHHEMVHLFNNIHDIKDTSGKRHNKKFHQACLDHGLFSDKIPGPIGYTTFDDREKQLPEWLEWFDQTVIDLDLNNHFQHAYVPVMKIKKPRINTSFICDETGQRFYLPDKLAKAYYDGELDSLTSPYVSGGTVTPADE